MNLLTLEPPVMTPLLDEISLCLAFCPFVSVVAHLDSFDVPLDFIHTKETVSCGYTFSHRCVGDDNVGFENQLSLTLLKYGFSSHLPAHVWSVTVFTDCSKPTI